MPAHAQGTQDAPVARSLGYFPAGLTHALIYLILDLLTMRGLQLAQELWQWRPHGTHGVALEGHMELLEVQGDGHVQSIEVQLAEVAFYWSLVVLCHHCTEEVEHRQKKHNCWRA